MSMSVRVLWIFPNLPSSRPSGVFSEKSTSANRNACHGSTRVREVPLLGLNNNNATNNASRRLTVRPVSSLWLKLNRASRAPPPPDNTALIVRRDRLACATCTTCLITAATRLRTRAAYARTIRQWLRRASLWIIHLVSTAFTSVLEGAAQHEVTRDNTLLVFAVPAP